MFYFIVITLLTLCGPVVADTILNGDLTQGGIVFGETKPGFEITLDGKPIRVSSEGYFLLGFSRDAKTDSELIIRDLEGSTQKRNLKIKQRKFKIQQIDGLPKKFVSPPKHILSRIREENKKIKKVRLFDRDEVFFRSGFIMPAQGRISGVYGSQRILNGQPRQPHFGIDIAAPSGAKVVAPADGIVVLAEADLYFSGGTVILDHGHGLTSAFLHLKKIFVKKGDLVVQSDVLGLVGSTGRSTGPHLDWRVNLFQKRIDPALLVSKEK